MDDSVLRIDPKEGFEHRAGGGAVSEFDQRLGQSQVERAHFFEVILRVSLSDVVYI